MSTTRTRQPLSRSRIIDAALRLVDTHGAEALTMRRLAQELGFEVMSLYTHVNGKSDILDGLAERLFEEIRIEGVDDWRSAGASFAHGIRETALRHPHAFSLVGTRPLTIGDSLTGVAPLFNALTALGLDGTATVAAFRAIASFARGYTLSEIWFGDRSSNDSTLDAIPQVDATVAFDFGLELILDGIASSVSRFDT